MIYYNTIYKVINNIVNVNICSANYLIIMLIKQKFVNKYVRRKLRTNCYERSSFSTDIEVNDMVHSMHLVYKQGERKYEVHDMHQNIPEEHEIVCTIKRNFYSPDTLFWQKL